MIHKERSVLGAGEYNGVGCLRAEPPASRSSRGRASGGCAALRTLRRVAVRDERFKGGARLMVDEETSMDNRRAERCGGLRGGTPGSDRS